MIDICHTEQIIKFAFIYSSLESIVDYSVFSHLVLQYSSLVILKKSKKNQPVSVFLIMLNILLASKMN